LENDFAVDLALYTTLTHFGSCPKRWGGRKPRRNPWWMMASAFAAVISPMLVILKEIITGINKFLELIVKLVELIFSTGCRP